MRLMRGKQTIKRALNTEKSEKRVVWVAPTCFWTRVQEPSSPLVLLLFLAMQNLQRSARVWGNYSQRTAVYSGHDMRQAPHGYFLGLGDMGKSRVSAAPSCEKWVARDSQGGGGGGGRGQDQVEPAKSG